MTDGHEFALSFAEWTNDNEAGSLDSWQSDVYGRLGNCMLVRSPSSRLASPRWMQVTRQQRRYTATGCCGARRAVIHWRSFLYLPRTFCSVPDYPRVHYSGRALRSTETGAVSCTGRLRSRRGEWASPALSRLIQHRVYHSNPYG